MPTPTLQLLVALSLIAIASGAKPVFKTDTTDKVTWRFKSRPKLDVSKIILEWEPFNMLEDTADVDSDGGLGVNIKSGDGEFIPVTVPPRVRGGRYTYTVSIVPCQEHQLQFYAKNSDGISYFYFPDTIAASSAEDIAASSYTLAAPANPRLDESEGSVAVYWDPSPCAARYYVSFSGSKGDLIERNTTEAKWEEHELRQCSEYDVVLLASLGSTYSGEQMAGLVSTPPSAEAGAALEPQLTPSQHGVSAAWDGYTALSCVSSYQVTLCHGDTCQEPAHVELDNTVSHVEYAAPATLEQCSEYSLHIRPEYPGQAIKEKVVQFRTLAPAMAELVTSLGEVTAVSGGDQTVAVSWAAVDCAAEYRVFQQLVTETEAREWELVTSTRDTSAVVRGVPCTEYRYGVRVVVAGQESEVQEAGASVVTPLDGEVYTASNLALEPATDAVELSWDHARCVHTYRLLVCPEAGPGECREQTEVVGEERAHNLVRVGGLAPCTAYTLQILAATGDTELQGETTTFRTAAPPPSVPGNFQLSLNDDTASISLSYEPVACAAGYNVYQTAAPGSEPELYKETSDTIVNIDSPQPCSDLSFAVAAVVEGKEGPRTEFHGVKIPPGNGDTSKPRLQIDQKFNTTVVLILSTPDFNSKCEVESYHVKYHNIGHEDDHMEATISISDLQEGKIVLDDFPATVEDGMKVEGRVKYLGFDSWSPWISSQNQKPEIVLEEGNGIIVPIVIGALIAVVVVIVLSFFIFKRKKSQNKYNCDKTDKSENKKLNDPEEA